MSLDTTTVDTARPRSRRPASTSSAPPLPAELEALLRRMRLPYLRGAAPDVIATAKAQRWDPAEVLPRPNKHCPHWNERTGTMGP